MAAFRSVGSDVHHRILTYLEPKEYVHFTAACRDSLALRTNGPFHHQNTLVDTCRLLHQVLDRGSNVLMHGPGGCGKTYALSVLADRAFSHGKYIVMTGTTGISACALVEGVTLHSFSGLGKGNMPLLQLEEDLERKPDACMRKFAQWRKVDILVIDEVSMLGTRFFKLLNRVAQFARRSSLPFGGVQLVLSGDFLQLPPVGDQFIFTLPEWESFRFQPVVFSTPYRQYGDPRFFQLLQRVRKGQVTAVDLACITERVCADVPDFIYEGVGVRLVPPFMFSHHKKADKINDERMASLPGLDAHSYAADSFWKITRTRNPDTGKMMVTRTAHPPVPVPDYIMNRISHRQPTRLPLKANAQYIITQNMHAFGVVNGTMVLLREDPSTHVQSVVLRNGKALPLERMRMTFFHCIAPKENLYMCREQYVLRVGYAITIHSAQGMTLEQAVVDAGSSIFASAQTYVAWSRVRQLQHLYLLDFDPKSIKVHAEARAFVAELEGFAHTDPSELVVMEEDGKKKPRAKPKSKASQATVRRGGKPRAPAAAPKTKVPGTASSSSSSSLSLKTSSKKRKAVGASVLGDRMGDTVDARAFAAACDILDADAARLDGDDDATEVDDAPSDGGDGNNAPANAGDDDDVLF